MSYCKQPDRHEPRMKCGYPLPCPHLNDADEKPTQENDGEKS